MVRGAVRRPAGHGGGDRARAAAVAVLLLALVAGCSGGSDPGLPAPPGQGAPTSSSPTTPTPPLPPAAKIAVTPADGTQGFSVLRPVVVTATAGTLTSVEVTNAEGRRLRGALDARRTSWSSSEQLGYDRSYSVVAVAANAAGKLTRSSSSFGTLLPRTLTLPYLFPGNGATVGVGQPITVRFDEPIADKAAAERALTVSTSPQVAGAWHWFSDQVVHWRPKTYWTPGTRASVRASVYGVHVGDDVYGQQDTSSSFRIGTSKIATIDDRTHMMTVRISGKAVRSIPVSMGRGGATVVDGRSIYFTTQSGPHIVAEKYPIKQMSSETYGLPKDSPLGYDEKIPLAVRISPDGEFVHAASWSVADQGVRNVSHGCVNISPANADWFYHTFSYGDIVDIKNTGVALPFAPSYDEWSVSWSTWLAGSALR